MSSDVLAIAKPSVSVITRVVCASYEPGTSVHLGNFAIHLDM
ncbi:hypothetical protein WKK05_17935 [Nostoc sp. UHCC 0302]